jgi:rRNA-processing protein FCF1
MTSPPTPKRSASSTTDCPAAGSNRMTDPKPMSGALVLLDANVLYPIRVCDFILTAASLRLIARPVASAAILDEAARNLTSDRPDAESARRIARRFEAVRRAIDGFDEPIPERFVDDSIVNAKDRHVLAAALHHGADFVITNDNRLRGEVNRWIEPHSEGRKLTAAISANTFASRLLAESPAGVEAVVREMVRRFRDPPRSFAEVAVSLSRSIPSLVLTAEHQLDPPERPDEKDPV